jgi:hypothetical protein
MHITCNDTETKHQNKKRKAAINQVPVIPNNKEETNHQSNGGLEPYPFVKPGVVVAPEFPFPGVFPC